jgi:rubrerythrin
MFVPLFKMHTSLLKRVFDELSPHEQNHLEELLKKVGRRAEKLAGMAESKRS